VQLFSPFGFRSPEKPFLVQVPREPEGFLELAALPFIQERKTNFAERYDAPLLCRKIAFRYVKALPKPYCSLTISPTDDRYSSN
jgi:hypothetical protein